MLYVSMAIMYCSTLAQFWRATVNTGLGCHRFPTMLVEALAVQVTSTIVRSLFSRIFPDDFI